MVQNIHSIGGDEVGELLALFSKLTTKQILLGAPLKGEVLKKYLWGIFRETNNNADIQEVRSEIEALKVDIRRVHRMEPPTYLSFRSRASVGVAMAKKTRAVESPSIFPAAKNMLAKAIDIPTLRVGENSERDYETTVCHDWFKQFVVSLQAEAKKGNDYLALRHGEEIGEEAPSFTTMENKNDPPLTVNTQSVFEVVAPETEEEAEERMCFSLESVARAKGFGERVLLSQPSFREFVDVVLCNCKMIQFFRVFRDPEDGELPWKYEESRVCSVQELEAQNALLWLFDSSSAPVKLPQFAGYHVTRWLGQGSASTVYEVRASDCSSNTERLVLKWSHNDNDNSNTELSDALKEKRILERLQELLPEHLRKHVPRVVQMQRHMLLMSPVCTNNNTNNNKQISLEKKDLQTLLALLEACHSNNIMHRDISPNNILRDAETGCILLNDWGSASEGDKEDALLAGGAFYFASDFVLQNLEERNKRGEHCNEGNHFFVYRPQDDLHSLIRVVAMQVKGRGSELLAQKTPQDVRGFWAGVLTACFWHDCAASAEELAYVNLCEQLQAFL